MKNENSGKYLYCFTSASKERAYALRGVKGGSDVYTIIYKDIAAVASDINDDVIKITANECLVHEKVLEEVIKDGTVIPFEFGTISPGREAVMQLMRDNYLKVKKLINGLRDKEEMNVRAVWPDMKRIFKEIVSENRHIALYKKTIEKKSVEETYKDRINIGQFVAQALYVKKEKERYSIVTALKNVSVKYVPEKIVGDSMIFNGAFLVRKTGVERFESALKRLGKKLDGRIDFVYAGPLPPYNFTNLKLTVRN